MPLLFLDNWFNNAFIQALGWTLLHSLWQGFLLVVLVSLAIVLTKRSTATLRYGIFSSLFFIFLGTTLFTFIIEYSSLRSIPTPYLLTGNEIGDTLTLSTNTHTAAVDLKVPLPGRLAFYFNEYGPWLMLLWFIVFMLKSIRLGINYAQVQRIRNEKPYVLPAIEKRVNELAKLLRIRRKVVLRETTSITVPVTIGFLKPLILIPCGLINNLPPDQVEAILLHELAHIRRMDYLVNLLQCLAETVFFFNPAVLWLSSLLREERENCCDDIAITVTQNKSLFIHALVAFQEYHAGHPIAPGLQGNKYPLLKRIQRIVYNNNKKLNHMEKIFLAAGLVVTGIVALAFSSPTTQKTNTPVAEISIAHKYQPSFARLKDSVPEHKIMTGSINSTIDGKKYKVIVKDDKPVALYINEKRVPDNELEDHHEIMERIMEEGRENFFKSRQQDEQAKRLLDYYNGQGLQAQKLSEEELLLEKIIKEQDRNKQLAELDSKDQLYKKMQLSRDEQQTMELRDIFLKDLQNDKMHKDLQDDKILKDLLNDKEGKLFKGDQDNAYRLLIDKIKKGGDDEKIVKEYLQQLDQQNALFNKDAAEKQNQLQRDQMQFEKMLQLYSDTAKPRRGDIKRKADSREMEYESKQKELEMRKKEIEMKSKEDQDGRLKEMAEYRAMLQKELKQTERKMDEEKRELERQRDNNRKEMEGERKEMQREREKDRQEMQKERERERKEMEGQSDEKRKEMQKEREQERKEMQENRENKMKEMQKERDKDRKEMEEESDRKRKEMQKERDKERREMEEERRKDKDRDEEDRKKDENDRRKDKDEKKKTDQRVYKGNSEFNYNGNKSTASNFNSKQETTYVNNNGKENLDYKLNAKGLKFSPDDKLKSDKEGQDNGKLLFNSPKPFNERVAAKRAESNERRKESNQHRDEIIKELKEDGIIPKEADQVSLHINDEEMTVNGVKQPDNVFNKYRNLIKKPKTTNEPKPISVPLIKRKAITPLKVV